MTSPFCVDTDATPRVPTPIHCPRCRRAVFDGEYIHSRIVRVTAAGLVAKCRCKLWVSIQLDGQTDACAPQPSVGAGR